MVLSELDPCSNPSDLTSLSCSGAELCSSCSSLFKIRLRLSWLAGICLAVCKGASARKPGHSNQAVCLGTLPAKGRDGGCVLFKVKALI